MKFITKLQRVQKRNNSLLCIGLDTDWKKLPEFLHEAENPVYEFNRRIIDATKDIACAYKLNLAFYENFGEAGLYAIHRTLARIPNHIVTIADAKRGDIGNTADKYADTYLNYFDFDAITVSPYMGGDSLEPFLKYKDKGIIILARTSNHGASDFQSLIVNGEPLYMHVVRKVNAWNVNGNCALVVGATAPEELAQVRSVVPTMPILLPGVGSQGGSVKESMKANGDGMIMINVSRAVIYASDGEDFAERARAEALKIRDDINKYR
jgi:orotidine-5'-phosphate decarboxylase